MKQLIPIGILVIFIGMILIFIGALSSTKEKTDTKVAVGGFIGFIPFGFANDKRMLYTIITISAIFMLLWIWFILQK